MFRCKLMFLLSLFAGIFAGCTTGGYGEFYQQIAPTTYPPTENVMVRMFASSGIKGHADELSSLQREAYVLVGGASFRGPYAGQDCAIRQAKKVGADLVFLEITPAGSIETAMPITQYHAPETTTMRSYGSATGSAFGSGGYAYGRAYGQSTSYLTTPGYTTTQWVPMTVPVYDHLAVFVRTP